MKDTDRALTAYNTSLDNKEKIKTIFGCIDSIKKHVYWVKGAVAVMFVVFSVLVTLSMNKMNYIQGRIDTLQSEAFKVNTEILQRVSSIEEQLKSNNVQHAGIQKAIESLKRALYYTRSDLKDTINEKN